MLDKDANSNNLVSLSVRRKLWQVKYQTKKGTGNPNRPTKGVRQLWEKCEKHQAKAVKLPNNGEEQDEEEEEQNASRRLAADNEGKSKRVGGKESRKPKPSNRTAMKTRKSKSKTRRGGAPTNEAKSES